MPTQESKRKLTAILSADVKGYSRLMSQDEEATVKALKQHRATISGLVSEHRGRVVDSPGDNILAEFGSVVDAVKCAVKIQETLNGNNAELPESRRMEFRIGVNLGDIIEEEDRIYGDGVNIAARLEGIAEAGGICISGTAFDHVKNKLSVGYQYLGEQTVKNIPDPVRAYKVLMEPEAAGKVIAEKEPKKRKWGWKAVAVVAVLILVVGGLVWNFYGRAPKIEPASKEKMAFPLPDKPSIAVLPFLNMSSNPEHDSLADSLSENIIYTLSYLPGMFVISRNSTFTYKGKPVEIRQVAEQLGVRYVLEGSVLRAEDRVRVTAQLIDATTGYHLWSGRFDRTLKDIFSLLDEITKNIAIELQVKVSPDQWAVLTHKTENFDAWAAATRAYSLLLRGVGEEAQVLAEKAVVLDPKYGFGWAALAALHTLRVYYGLSQSPADSIKLAAECNEKALTLDATLSCATANRGQIHLLQGNVEEAIAFGKKAIDMAPSLDANYIIFGMTMDFAGRFEEAIPLFKNAMRLNPFYPARYLKTYGMSCLMADRKEEALIAFKELLQRAQRGESPPPLVSHLGLCAVYAELGREIEAKTHVQEILKINPSFSLEDAKKVQRWKDPKNTERWVSSLRKAGIPDKPPLPLPDKPSIAVLPFVNMSDDKSQEFFSDGISEDIITDLSKLSGLIVIARNSSFTYKGKTVNVQQIGQDLKVRYLLEGSVRKAGDQVRINAQLIDASNGQHLWAERYDGRMGDIFTLQDGITRKIVSALALKLTASEQKALADKGTDNALAYEEYLKGWENYRQHTNESFARAKVYLEKAVELDPEFARAYAALAVLYFKAVQTQGLKQGLGLTDERKVAQASLKSRFLLGKAMKKPTALAHGMMSQIYLSMFLHNEAFAEIERAIAMDPNNPELHDWKSTILWFMGKDREAVESAKTAIRLDPNNPAQYFIRLARAYLPDGNLQESLTLLERARTLNPQLSGVVALIKSIIYGLQSRDQEARTAYEVFAKSRLAPPRNLEEIMAYYPFSDLKVSDRIAEALVRAGAPGKPSEYCRVSRDNLLKGREVKNLLFGHKITGISPSTGEQFWFEWSRDGDLDVIRGALRDKGKSWIEGDVMFVQLEKITGGLFWNYTTYRNPDGTKEQRNQYIWVDPSRNITYFSPAE